jgi:hypothetical protein
MSTVFFPKCQSIGERAFHSCASLTTVSFPQANWMGRYASMNDAALKSAFFPLLTFIPSQAFQNCYSLQWASFPNASYLSVSAFLSCYSLRSLYLLSDSLCALHNSNALQSTPFTDSSYLGVYGSIFVPESLVAEYRENGVWSWYASRITAYGEG